MRTLKISEAAALLEQGLSISSAISRAGEALSTDIRTLVPR